MLPRVIRHQIARPAMCDLMCDHIRERAIASEKSRRHEREARVLHPSVRERGRHAEDVIRAWSAQNTEERDESESSLGKSWGETWGV